MAFLKVDPKHAAAANVGQGQSDWIQTSGIYLVKLRGIEIEEGTEKAIAANYIAENVISYNNTLRSKKGEKTWGYDILEAMAVVVGLAEWGDPTPTQIQYKQGMQTKNILPESVGLEVYVQLRFEYRIYKGTIRESVTVSNVFNASTKATSSELLNNGTPGETYAKDLEYASTVSYKDGVTAEAVEAWRRANAAGTTAPAVTPTKSVDLPSTLP